MKINPVNRFFSKAHNFGPIAVIWGATSLLAGGAYPAALIYENKCDEKAKQEILAKDPERFERVNPSQDGFRWTEEARRMNDSLKIDSIIQRAYFEGAQMVRDSIAGAK